MAATIYHRGGNGAAAVPATIYRKGYWEGELWDLKNYFLDV